MVKEMLDILVLAIGFVSCIVGIYAWASAKPGQHKYRWLFIIIAILFFAVFFYLKREKGQSNTDPEIPGTDTSNNHGSDTEKKGKNQTTVPVPIIGNKEKEHPAQTVTVQKSTADVLVIGSTNQLQDILQDIQTVVEKKGNTAITSSSEFSSLTAYKGKYKKLIVVHVQLNNINSKTSLSPEMISINYSYSVKYYNVETGQLINEKSEKSVAEPGYSKEAIIEEIKKNIIEETKSLL